MPEAFSGWTDARLVMLLFLILELHVNEKMTPTSSAESGQGPGEKETLSCDTESDPPDRWKRVSCSLIRAALLDEP